MALLAELGSEPQMPQWRHWLVQAGWKSAE
jgi:hypothetical protein